MMASNRSLDQARQRGFTLLEVLVALAIFAITAAAMINGITTSLAAQSHLERKTIAHWVAMNQLTEVKLQATWPSIGLTDGTEEMTGHEWFWTRKVEETADPKLRRVDIEVRTEREDETPIVRLSGFVTDRPEQISAPTVDDGDTGYSEGGKEENPEANPESGEPPEENPTEQEPGGDK